MDMLAHARSLGFAVDEAERVHLDAPALRLLSADSFAVPLDARAGVLEVLVDHVPTPAQFEALERASGHRVTIVVTSPQVLERTRAKAAAIRSASAGRSVRSLWQAARESGALGVAAVPGQAPALLTLSGPRPLELESAVSSDEISQWSQDILAGRPEAVVPDGDDLWRVRAATADSSVILLMHRLPARVSRADELGLPASATSLSSLDSGLVLISGPAASGRSSVALALAERSLSSAPRASAVIASLLERRLPSRLAASWAVQVGTDEPTCDQAVSSALASGAQVLVVDCPDQPDALSAATRAALSGALVFVVVSARDVTSAVLALRAASGPDEAAACFAGALACRLLPDGLGQPVSVFEVAQGSATVRAAIATAPTSLPLAVEAGGLASGTTLEAALAGANAAGRLPFETARSAALDLDRFDAATGRLHSPLASKDLDVDSSLLAEQVGSSSPARRRRRR